MGNRIEDAISRLEIRELTEQYAVYLDSGQFKELETVFADDATYNISPDPGIVPLPLKGCKAICKALEDRYHEVQKTAQRRHVVSNVIFDEFSGDHARIRSFLTVLSVPKSGAPAELRGTAIYADRLVRKNDKWQIAERVCHVDVLSGT